jgi:hypothetical protein
MRSTNSEKLRALSCVPGGIYRARIFKTYLDNDFQTLSRPVVNVWEFLSFKSVTLNAFSWRSLVRTGNM